MSRKRKCVRCNEHKTLSNFMEIYAYLNYRKATCIDCEIELEKISLKPLLKEINIMGIVIKCSCCKSMKDEKDFPTIKNSKKRLGICKKCVDLQNPKDDEETSTDNKETSTDNKKIEIMSNSISNLEKNVTIKCSCCGDEKSIYAYSFMVKEQMFLDKCDECISNPPIHHELNQSKYDYQLKKPLSENALSGDDLKAFGVKYLNAMLTTTKKLRLNDGYLDNDIKIRCQYLLDTGYVFNPKTITVKSPPNKINRNGKILDGLYNKKAGITFRMIKDNGEKPQVGVSLVQFIYYINLVQFKSLKSKQMENQNQAAQGAKNDTVVSDVETSNELSNSFKSIEILLKSKDVTIAQLQKQIKDLELQLAAKVNSALETPKTTSAIKCFLRSKKPDTSKENIDFIAPLIYNKLIKLNVEPIDVNGIAEYPLDVLNTEFEIVEDFVVW